MIKITPPKCKKTFVFFLLATFVCFELGNSIKNLVLRTTYLLGHENPIFSIVAAKNTGGAFSILQNQAPLLATFGIVAILAAVVYVYRRLCFENKIEIMAFVLFCSGVLGNAVERLTQGHVFDYIKLNFVDFPVFNAFDIMISASVILYAAFLIFGEKLYRRGRKDGK